ncbi:MAG: respiratory nitrate reductase subunit gamma [Deltaproteobacteria bacterium]|nr:respiratory nitrate reductase subunit gamma [Deltaproteobacteria bacterium]
MSWNTLVFVVFPYVAVALAISVTALRAWWMPSTLTSRTSQLLEHRKLLWGSVPFHWGLTLTLAGHFLGLLIPRGLEAWNAVPLRLFVQEATAFGLGVWALGGLAVLVWRRAMDARVRKVTTPMDLVVLGLLAVSVVTGLTSALAFRFGSYWFPSVFTPYLRSLLILSPRPELVLDLPWLLKLHVLAFFTLLAVFPFSRLVHVVTVPFGYLVRPWQVVLWSRRPVPLGGTGR